VNGVALVGVTVRRDFDPPAAEMQVSGQ